MILGKDNINWCFGAVGGIVSVAVVALPLCAQADGNSNRADGLYVSHVHRGGGKLERPDNTLETFKWCWENGSALECDCRRTKDGVGIMLHDDRLKRTGRGISPELATNSVSRSLTWDEIRDVDVGSYLDPKFAHHRIPTIEQTFAAMKGHPTYLCFVDEKGAGPEYIAAKAVAAGVQDQVYYTGPSYKNIVKWNATLPGGKSLLWIGAFPKSRDADARRRVREHFEKVMSEVRQANFRFISAVSIHTYYDPNDKVDQFILGTDYLKSLIDEFHAHGVKVCSIPFAGGDREEVYYKLWELGCDGFSTDYPSVMFKVIKALKARTEPFETARWIGVAGRHFGWGDRGAHPAPVFRKEFVGERASGGRLAITGAGYYYAELNGRPVTDARLTPTPSNYDRAVHWTEYDVSPLLRDGTNVLEVTLGSGFYDYSLEDNFLMSQASWRDSPMFIAELRDASGRVRLATDATWDVCVEGPWRFDSIRRGTVYDARLEKLDDPKAWRKAEKKHGVGGVFRRADHPPVRVIARRPMRRLPTGIWDSGQNAAGVCELKVRGEAGAEVVLVHREDVEADGSLHEFASFQKGEFMTDHYILRGDPAGETWTPRFTYHGFRYVRAEVRGKAEVLGLTQLALSSDFKSVGALETSDPLLARLQQAFLWSCRSNFVGYPTDCPTREKQGWSGDALAACESGLYNFDAASAYVDWLRGFADVQRPNGQLPAKSPISANGFNWGYGPGWDEALALIPWQIYVMRGDLQPAKELYPAMRRYRKFAHEMMTDGLAVDFGLGDWCDPAGNCWRRKDSVTANATCYHYLGLVTTAKLADRLGETDDAERWRAEAEEVKSGFQQAFCRPDGGVASDLPTDLALAVAFGLAPDARRTATRLAETVRKGGHLQRYGIFGAKYVPRVLMDFGFADDALKLVKAREYPSVLHYLERGATTLWERYDGSDSRNHVMFGDMSAWMFRYLGGFRFDERSPGELILEPVAFREVGSFKATYRGVKSAWTFKDGGCTYTVSVPAGGRVTLRLPNREPVTLAEGLHEFAL